MSRIAIFALLLALLAGCASKTETWRKGGTPGLKPYTIAGKTYYPLKSSHGFVEEGIASWYGPGFHGKKTANGETYNQYAMTAAHKILPLGTQVRVTHLDTGRSIIVRVNDRGPFVADRVIDLSRAAATRLDMLGKGTARVRVQSIGGDNQQATLPNGKVYIQVGAFSQKENARKIINVLTKAGYHGRLIFGRNNMWNVQAGPVAASENPAKLLDSLATIYPHAFIVAAD